MHIRINPNLSINRHNLSILTNIIISRNPFLILTLSNIIPILIPILIPINLTPTPSLLSIEYMDIDDSERCEYMKQT